MKKEIPKEEKRNEFWYCILIVAGLILLLLGDQIALRFIQKNPNSNNSIFGSSEKIGKYQIDFLEELSLNQVIEKINHKEKFLVLQNAEITIEVNPGTVTLDKLQAYFESGINRISIGLQSTYDTLLKQLGRIHTYQEFLDTYYLARQVGFENINVDLMLGLPNQTVQEIQNSVEEVIGLEPEHISLYSLIVEEGTRLEKQIQNGELTLPDETLEDLD